ncbi:MAG: hypothetical protein AAF632_13975 [Bacteroidota bacterium]
MKKLSLFLLAGLFLACEEQNTTDSPPPLPVEEVPLPAADTRVLPPGDPNLDPTWNWEDSQWDVYFTNIFGSVVMTSTVNPFYREGVFGHADPDQIDMRAEDGWILVARDFGTPTDAPTQPWIMLYNKYRGLLRVGVLTTDVSETGYRNLSLSFGRSDSPPNLFTFTEGHTQSAAILALFLDWAVGEFNLQGYDPSIDRQARFHLGIHDVAESSTELRQGSRLDHVAQPKSSGVLTTVYQVGSYSFKFWEQLPQLGNDDFRSSVEGLDRDARSIISSVGGLIRSLTSSGPYPYYSVTLEPDVWLAGTITLGTPQGGIEVYLHPDANNSGYPKALNPIPWGVMDYTRAIEVIDRQPPGDFLVINPAIAESISSIEAGWIRPGRAEVQFEMLSAFESTAINYDVSAVAIRLTFNNGDVVYNRVPIK